MLGLRGASLAHVALATFLAVRAGSLRLDGAQAPASEIFRESGLNGTVLNETVHDLAWALEAAALARDETGYDGAGNRTLADESAADGNWSDSDTVLINSRGPPVPVGNNGTKRLVFVHIPLSFGHTIEKEVMMLPDSSMDDYVELMKHALLIQSKTVNQLPEMHALREDLLEFVARKDAVFWGAAHPEAMDVSSHSGCLYAHTAPRYWPTDRKRSYFGHQFLAFGVVRNPYERLVSIFRQQGAGYLKDASSWDKWTSTCDVNGFLTEMLGRFRRGATVKEKSLEECLFMPQSNYFVGQYGIKLAVDGWRFPDSVNEVLNQYGFPDAHIGPEDLVMDEFHCPNLWAGNLTPAVRLLVRQTYQSDFTLLCRRFGYCDWNEPSCIPGVPGNCPSFFEEDQREKAGKPTDERTPNGAWVKVPNTDNSWSYYTNKQIADYLSDPRGK